MKEKQTEIEAQSEKKTGGTNREHLRGRNHEYEGLLVVAILLLEGETYRHKGGRLEML